jgi:hypothetical protein
MWTSVLTARMLVYLLKDSVFLVITPCSLLKVNRRFGDTCRLSLQGRRIVQARNECKAASKQYIYCYKVLINC